MLKKIKSKVDIYVVLACYIILIAIISLMSNYGSIKLSIEEIYPLNDNWELQALDGSYNKQTLPVNLETKTGDSSKLSISLDDTFAESQTLRVRASMEYVKVLLDDEVIYNSEEVDNHFPYKSDASHWVLIDIPSKSDGLELELHIKSNVPVMSGRVNEIYYGDKGDLIWELVEGQIISILLAFFILSLSVFTFVISFFVKKSDSLRIKYLSVFSFSIALWLISELDIVQLFSGKIFIVGTLSYIMLPIALVALIYYLKIVVLYKYSKIFKILSRIVILYQSVAMFVQIFFGIHMIRSWNIFMVLIIIVSLTFMILLVKEALNHNREAKKYILYLLVLIVTGIMESVMFITGFFMDVSKLSIMGITVFLVLLLVDSLKDLSEKFEKEGEARYLREIAFKDYLTGSLNRTSFEKDIDLLLSNKDKHPFRLTMFDLNDLKRINDKHGHQVGDIAIVEFSKLIHLVYRDDLDKCYRVGGDEFMIVQQNITEKAHLSKIERLQVEIVNKNKKLDFELSTAFGSDVFIFDRSFNEFKHDVDQKMYEYKRDLKKKNYS